MTGQQGSAWTPPPVSMSDPTARTFRSDFKRFFVRGLVILLPTMVTLWIVVTAYQFIDSKIAQPINSGMKAGLKNLGPYWRAAGSIHDWWENHWYMDLIGLAVAIVAVYVTGYLLGGFLGRGMYRHFERIIISLPVFKQVYPYVKQIVDFLFSDKKGVKFNCVVLVEYPRKGIWSIGFQTGGTMQSIYQTAGDCVTIFIPSSPTPFTGYTITVPRSEVLELPLTVDEAIRFVVSGGVLVPDRQQIPAALQSGVELPASEENAAATALAKRVSAAACAARISASTEPSPTIPNAPVAIQHDSGGR